MACRLQLRPRSDLREFLERTEAARQGDEPIRQLGHDRLSLVERADDAQLRDAGMRELAVHEPLRDHPDHLATGIQRGVGERAHQADTTATIDGPDAALREAATDRAR